MNGQPEVPEQNKRIKSVSRQDCYNGDGAFAQKETRLKSNEV